MIHEHLMRSDHDSLRVEPERDADGEGSEGGEAGHQNTTTVRMTVAV